MIIQPKVRGFICTNAHPLGCAENVNQQIEYTRKTGRSNTTVKNILVIGGSTGYGLASRIVSTFGYGANTLGVFFERPPTENKTASPGFYNSCAFQKAARTAGLYAEGINCDAFSKAGKQQVIEKIKADFKGGIDLVVYSLASPKRIDPETGVTYKSSLKPIGGAVTSKTLNTDTCEVSEITIAAANAAEIEGTIKVMGGEDWELWLDTLQQAQVLSNNCKTVAYTYLGKSITWPIYGRATIGKAKEDLERAAACINANHNNVTANIGVLKGLVTQASSAIPVMPLYIALLYKVMKQQGSHEGCIQQINRLFRECIYSEQPRTDEKGRWRVDELELDDKVQDAVIALWQKVHTENLKSISDYEGYMTEFMHLFGFGFNNINYDACVDPVTSL